MKLCQLILYFLLLGSLGSSLYAQVRKPVVWIFSTELTGEMNGMIATAEKMNAEIIVVPLPRSLIEAEKRQERSSDPKRKLKIDAAQLDLEVGNVLKGHPAPDYVFNCLNRTSKLIFAEALKRQHKSATYVNFYDPQSHYDTFDIIINGSHLDPIARSNVFEIEGVPSKVTGLDLTKYLQPQLMRTQNPVMAVLLGGKAKDSNFTVENALSLARILNHLSDKYQLEYIVTNSRRTGADVWNAFLKELKAPRFTIDWQNPDPRMAQPYFSALAQAHSFVVTGDSMSMISDAVSTGKPTYIFAPEGSLENRHKKFILEMAMKRRILPLSITLRDWKYEPLDSASQAAQLIISKNSCRSSVGGLHVH